MAGGLTLRLTTTSDGDCTDPANLERTVAALDLIPEVIVTCRQVHGARVVEAMPGVEPAEADGLVTREPLVSLALLGADCPLICLYDEEQPALLVLHAGWRGILAGVLEAGIHALDAGDHREVHGWISAHAGPCCYEVGEEVAARFPAEAVVRREAWARPHLDLRRAIEGRLDRRLQRLSKECTICGRSYFSYRRTRTGERHALIAALTP